MRRLVALLAFLLLGSAASDEVALRRLLDEFLAGASRNDPAVHARFWADDLVYTSSSGKRMGKADILRDVNAPSAQEEPQVTYSAQEVQVRLYGKTAVVAFRLVTPAQQYFNTGTFVKRDGRWQAVAWQATKIPS